MKTQLLFIMSLYLFLFTCTISAYDYSVLDSQGNKLQEGSKYYVVSAIRGAGGGLSVSTTWGRPDCPTTIAREAADSNYGIPVTFHPAVSGINGTIQLSQSLNVKFDPDFSSIPGDCANSTVWTVGVSEILTIEGVEGNPGCSTRTNWFKIEEGQMFNVYKFTYNPNDVCKNQTFRRKDVAVTSFYGASPLVLSNDPYPFPFLNVRFIKYVPASSVIRNKAAA